MEAKVSRRSRDGCTTCKRRKKKCDGVKPECLTCQRLHLTCGGFQARLLFENDPIREGIRRRGPPRKDRGAGGSKSKSKAAAVEEVSQTNALSPRVQQPSPFPEQSDADALLWDSYINRFCKTYTTVTDNSSPFLSVIVPLALRYEVVRHAVLAIAALQLDLSSRPDLYEALKLHRQQAQQSVSSHLDSLYQHGDMDQIMSIGTASVLLLSASKLSGQPYDIVQGHLRNIRHLTAQVSALSIFPRHAGSFKTKLLGFWKKIMSYTDVLADLVGVRKSHSDILDEFDALSFESLEGSHQLFQPPRFETLVARINSHPEQVSSLDIDTWGGELDFLPSVTTTPTISLELQLIDRSNIDTTTSDYNGTITTTRVDDDTLIREIYRTTLRIAHFKKLRCPSTFSLSPSIRHTYTTLSYPPFIAQSYITSLTRLQMKYMRRLTPSSRYDTSLLLPLGVTGPEVSRKEDRAWIIEKLTTLEAKLGFPQLGKCRRELVRKWDEVDLANAIDRDGEIYLAEDHGTEGGEWGGSASTVEKKTEILLWG